MPTQQIAVEQWEEFLSAFSAHNQTRKVVVDMESTELGPQRVVDGKPLLAIEPDLEGAVGKRITVIAGDTQGDDPVALTHQVMNPQSIWLKEDDQGNQQALDIETDDGRTIIQLS